MATHTFEKVVLNQGDADDAILQGKSSDVDHGITTYAETDTYFALQKHSATAGGLLVRGLSETNVGVKVQGLVTTDDTTKSNAAVGAVMVSAHKKSGTGLTTLAANTNLFTVDNGDTVRFIMDADGDSHQDVGTAWTTFDVCDDVEMLNVLTAFCTRRDDPLRRQFGHWLTVPENRDRLEAMRLATFNDGPGGDGSIFVNMSRVTMLLVGAVRQGSDERKWLRERMDALEARLNLLLPAVA